MWVIGWQAQDTAYALLGWGGEEGEWWGWGLLRKEEVKLQAGRAHSCSCQLPN